MQFIQILAYFLVPIAVIAATYNQTNKETERVLFKPNNAIESHRIRVVMTLTTSPKRIHQLPIILPSLLQQTVQPDVIQINLPYVFKRNNATFPNLEELKFLDHPLIRIHR